MRTCETCIFFDEKKFECHFNPPVVVWRGVRLAHSTRFPSVEKDHWCGKHQSKSIIERDSDGKDFPV